MALLPIEYMNAVVSIGKKVIPGDPNSDIFWMATGFVFGYRTDVFEDNTGLSMVEPVDRILETIESCAQEC